MNHIQSLFQQYNKGTATAAQQEELAELVTQYSNEELADILEPLAAATVRDPGFQPADWEHIILSILRQPAEKSATIRTRERKAVGWKRWAIAASILLALGLGSYFAFHNKRNNPQQITKATDVDAPAVNRATITLADGRRLFLDSMNNGELVQQGDIKLVKLDNGQIAYRTTVGGQQSTEQYNTLSNPRGSKVIDMTLADGSHIWLNAGSSLRYPVAFVGDQRKVEITGEAYFEISHDKSKPFIVSTNDKTDVTVLGTHFNVNAYDDEQEIKVTLLEGSVRVSSATSALSAVKIKPGQQAEIINNQLSIINNPDLEQVMAWKNGEFQFGDKSDINTIMRQISRWYNVEVEYKGNITGHIGGSISRNVNLSQVLKMLEKTGGVKFKIEGNKVTVMP